MPVYQLPAKEADLSCPFAPPRRPCSTPAAKARAAQSFGSHPTVHFVLGSGFFSAPFTNSTCASGRVDGSGQSGTVPSWFGFGRPSAAAVLQSRMRRESVPHDPEIAGIRPCRRQTGHCRGLRRVLFRFVQHCLLSSQHRAQQPWAGHRQGRQRRALQLQHIDLQIRSRTCPAAHNSSGCSSSFASTARCSTSSTLFQRCGHFIVRLIFLVHLHQHLFELLHSDFSSRPRRVSPSTASTQQPGSIVSLVQFPPNSGGTNFTDMDKHPHVDWLHSILMEFLLFWVFGAESRKVWAAMSCVVGGYRSCRKAAPYLLLGSC